MRTVRVEEDQVRVGERFAVSFQRTLRVPEDGKAYPLPPGLGAFPIHRVEDYREAVPPHWKEKGGVFIPMYQREAMWLGFTAAWWKPNAVKVGVGGINALTGEEWHDQQEWSDPLQADPQDYIVCPVQPWLDGFNQGEGLIRQFVAMPLGQGYTAEEQLTGKAEFGGVQIVVFEPKPGKFPDEPPQSQPSSELAFIPESAPVRQLSEGEKGTEMGLAAGGAIRQKIYPDPYGPDTWDRSNVGVLRVHIVNSEQYEAITARRMPASPISARTYSEYGFPWFEIYDDEMGTLPGSERLSGLKGVSSQDRERRGRTDQDQQDDANQPIEIKSDQIQGIKSLPSGKKHRND